MNLKQSLNRKLRGHVQDADVNLTAVMNIFLILIPFLLLTATFVRITVLELSLPNLEKSGQARATTQSEPAVLNILLIRQDQLQIKSPDLDFSPVKKTETGYIWTQLTTQLIKVKSRYPEIDDIIIAPEDNIEYDTIIQIMDYCRESGFPNISISG